MELRRCGYSDLRLSILGTGCWSFGSGEYWGKQNQKDVEDVVHSSLDFGINYFDTAESYNEGRSETSLGKALKGIQREKVIICTKISPQNGYPEKVLTSLECSLRRLNTDYIDIYMIHWPIHSHSIRHFTDDERIIKNPPRIQDTVEALKKLKYQGKIRYFGISNFGINRIDELKQLNLDVIVNELPYSLLTRAIEYDILPYCSKHNIGVIGYMTLLQGILADIYSSLDDVPVWQRRTRHFKSTDNCYCRHGGDGYEDETKRTLEKIRVIMNEYNISMPEIAIQLAISNSCITSVLVGARNLKELEANVRVATSQIDKEMVRKLNLATKPLMDKMGRNFDYYENEENDRTI